MIYLFSQIAISLVLAAIVGGVLGWLTHRAKAGKQIRNLQQVVNRQQQHVNEAQTEVSIIAGDFDDLKQRTESEISALKIDNQKIPALNQNLEKSQLLVRQLMQQHKAELDELTLENEKLVMRAKQVEEREKAVAQLQANLGKSQTSTTKQNKNDTADTKTDAESSQSQAELLLDNEGTGTASVSVAQDSDEKPDCAQATDVSRRNLKTTRLPLSGNSIPAESGNLSSQMTVAPPTSAVNKAELPSAAETEAELEALRDQLAEGAPEKPVSPPPHTLSETEVDDAELEQLFETVDHQDDLKQIFGIGPVTEKTLNKLGITAYSQLAELKQHDIEKIADALQIFPGRIERDNWVGSARAQLEEVLEEL